MQCNSPKAEVSGVAMLNSWPARELLEREPSIACGQHHMKTFCMHCICAHTHTHNQWEVAEAGSPWGPRPILGPGPGCGPNLKPAIPPCDALSLADAPLEISTALVMYIPLVLA